MSHVQILAFLGSLFFLGFIVESIRRKRLRKEYSLLWLFFGIVFITFSLWREGLEIIAGWAGIFYAPAAFFLLLFIAVFALLFHFSVILSRLTESVTSLVQEIGLLKAEAEEKITESGESSPGGGNEGNPDGDGGDGGEDSVSENPRF